MPANVAQSETAKLKTCADRLAHLAECRERAVAVMAEVSDALADDRLELEDLANEVVALAQVIHGLAVFLGVEEVNREAARQHEAAVAVEVSKTLAEGQAILNRTKTGHRKRPAFHRGTGDAAGTEPKD
jgi:hypothetical protein